MNKLIQNKFIFSLSICLVLIILFTGCAQTPAQPEPTAPPATTIPKTPPDVTAPKPASTPVQEPVSEPTPPPTPPSQTALPSQPAAPPQTPKPSPAPSGPSIEPTTEPTLEIASSPNPGSIAKLGISKTPSVGEPFDITFTLDVTGPLKPITKVWLEFEYFDPAQWYPLGMGADKDAFLRRLDKYFDASRPSDVEDKILSEIQPETVVPIETVVSNGNTVWQGTSLKPGDRVTLNATASLPEEGEWCINARWQADDGISWVCQHLSLTVNKDSGKVGWSEKYPAESFRQPPSQYNPIGAILAPGTLPPLGESLDLAIKVFSMDEVEQGEVFLKIIYLEGDKTLDIPLKDVLVGGNLSYNGRLQKNAFLDLSGKLVFPYEGRWGIYAITHAGPEKRESYKDYITFYVGKEKSHFYWPEPDSTTKTADQIDTPKVCYWGR